MSDGESPQRRCPYRLDVLTAMESAHQRQREYQIREPKTRCDVADSDDGLMARLWEGLLDLYAADREAFYRLAVDGVPGGRRGEVDEMAALADLAARVRMAVRNTYRVEWPQSSVVLVRPYRGGGTALTVPQRLWERVRLFLLEVDGKQAGAMPGKDLLGRKVSEAEVKFKLGG